MTYFDVAYFIDINNSSDKVVANMNLFGNSFKIIFEFEKSGFFIRLA